VAEREWREASDMRTSRLGLAAALACAALLRFWGIGHGVPYAVGADEPAVMEAAVRMMKSGDFNPHFFHYPALYFYAQLAVAVGRYLLGAIGGAWSSLDQVSAADFYYAGRMLTALLGTLTVLLVYQIGMRWGSRHGLLAAGVLAVMPLHVRESHFVLTDVPATFLTTLTFLLSLIALERASWRAFAAAGFAAGLAAATKYNAGLVLILPLVGIWMTLDAKPSRVLCATAAIAACLAGYLIGAPYSLLDLPGFLNDFGDLSRAIRARRIAAEPVAIVYFKHLRNAFGWPATILLVAGLVLAIVRASRGPGRGRWALLLVFPLAYFAMVARSNFVFARYILPLVPFLAVMIAVAVISGVSLLRRFDIPRAPRTAMIVLLTLVVLVPPATSSIGFGRQMSRPTTEGAAYRWLRLHAPRGARIAVERRVLTLPSTEFDARGVGPLTEMTYSQYLAEGYQFLIASSYEYGPIVEAPQRFPERYAAYRQLFDQSIERQVIQPGADLAGPELRILELPR
jgi:4-amino-4-deoxy-L-arabinose transferase-like glycosyltransferase